MPWEIRKEGKGWWVVKKGTNSKVHKTAHSNRAEAVAHMKALYASEDIGYRAK